MREQINNNPMVQIGLIAVLGLLAAVMLLPALSGHKKAEPATDATGAPVPAAAVGSPDSSGATPPDAAIPDGAAPAAPAGAADTASVGAMVAGPGLPAAVVRAYERGDAVVLLIARPGSIEDRLVTNAVKALHADPNVTVFVTDADGIARYARITEGVGVDRTPALVVVRPKHLSGKVPEAQVGYGYRTSASVVQAVNDALYDGPNIPYHPR